MTTLVDKLVAAAWEKLSISCFGMDPVPEKMPFDNFDIGKVVTFYDHMLAEMNGQKVFPGAFKPNEGFYSRHDAHLGIWTFDGSRMLKRLIDNAKQLNIPVILDAKRGDIGKSSENYAAEAFEVFGADAVTISPYMGTDSVEPFLKKGAAYVLCRTSNPGGKDLQNLKVMAIDGGRAEPLYMHVAHKIIDWSDISPGNIGAVVGATNIPELTEIARAFARSDRQIPLLIPGVGKQGGSAKEVVAALKEVGYNLDIVRINSSSELNFAWEKEGNREDYAGAAVRALEKLNREIAYAPRKI